MKKFLKFMLNVVLIILIIYILTVLYKITILTSISYNSNKIKDNDNYSYYRSNQLFIDYFDINKEYIIDRPKVEYHIYNYGEKQKIESKDVGRFETFFCTEWNNYNVDNKSYYTVTSFLNEPSDDVNYNFKQSYDYQIGFSYEQLSPYGLITYVLDDFYRKDFVLNPFKTIKIDFDFGDFILTKSNKDDFEGPYKKEMFYMDIATGLVRKMETYKEGELVELNTFWNYSFNCNSESNVEIDEEYKNEIETNKNTQKLENNNIVNSEDNEVE